MRFVCEKTVTQLSRAMEMGEISSLGLTMQYLERIAEIDKSGPCLNSVIEINPDALDIAAAMDRERQIRGARGMLHGIPVLIKANTNTKDKMTTSAGSLSMAAHYACADATIVRKLRDAGAVILGKTNLTELSNYMSLHMKNGYSSHGGQTKSPYNPTGDVCGSSSGSAVAVSANLCAVAIGTETCGSILGPAIHNGIVGIKPTHGLVSRTGIVPICTAQDTAGSLARNVKDAAVLLNAICAEDPEDPATWHTAQYHKDYATGLGQIDISKLRIGVSHSWDGHWSKEQLALADAALRKFSTAGVQFVNSLEKIDNAFPCSDLDYAVMFYEFKACINAYLASNNCPVQSLSEIISYNNRNPEQCLKYRQERLEQAEFNTTGALTEPEYLRARVEQIEKANSVLAQTMAEWKLDAIVLAGWNDLPAISGYPAIAVPCGITTSDHMPFGITLIGRPFHEDDIINIADAFERIVNGRVCPDM